MTLWKCLVACVALLALSVVEEGFAVLVPVAAVWLGILLAVRLRPSIHVIVTERRLPTQTEIAAILIGQGGAVLTLGAIGLSMSSLALVIDARLPDLKDGVGWMFWLVTTASATVPMWRRIASGDASGRMRPLAAGLLAAAPLGLGLGALWLSWLDEPSRPYSGGEDILNAVMTTPFCALLIGFGITAIVQALRDDTEVRPVFRATIAIAGGAWALVALTLAVGLAGVGGADKVMAARGGEWSSGYGILAALAWMVGLWQARGVAVDRTLSILPIVVLLMITFLASLWVAGMVLSTEWTDLVALLLVPLAVATAAFCAFGVPALIRLLTFTAFRLPGRRFDALRQRV